MQPAWQKMVIRSAWRRTASRRASESDSPPGAVAENRANETGATSNA
ncbi:uncharacterized protein METZ01_LOCUS94557 [marine metagenome]|uniref:Uncharacterized protein n=1 Tax=marine metagenome TaxID=408172 RepID=A0A381VQA0_9ZZZZ